MLDSESMNVEHYKCLIRRLRPALFQAFFLSRDTFIKFTPQVWFNTD